jgi:hypothetical protein
MDLCAIKSRPEPDSSSHWSASAQHRLSLEPIHDLNRRALDLLAGHSDATIDCGDFHPATSVGRMLHGVGEWTLQSLALSPFLLADASFEDANRWRSLVIQGAAEPRPSLIPESHTAVLSLAYSTCLVAWHLARTDRVAARLILGLSGECAATVARIGLTDLQRIAVCIVRRQWLRPRWHDRPEVWRRLIRATQASRHATPGPVSVRALQLFLGDLLGDEMR